MAYKNVVVAGATGNLGSVLLEQLVESKHFNITVLTRKGSKSKEPTGVKVIQVDYTSASDLEAALKDQDVVVSNLVATAFDAQKALIDASIATGVKRFIPSEFGSDMETSVGKFPVFAHKVKIQEYLKSKVDSLTYTLIYNSAFLDWGLQAGFIIDSKGRKANLFDEGRTHFSVNRLSTIGKALVQVLLHPEETKNRAVRFAEAETSQAGLMEIVREIDPSQQFEVTDTDTDKFEEQLWSDVQDGKFTEKVMVGFICLTVFGKNYDAILTPLDNELLGVKTLTKEELKEVVKAYM